ncbi:MAG: hypothetical protein WCP35_14950 [Verrucomicrobiota bacterium]
MANAANLFHPVFAGDGLVAKVHHQDEKRAIGEHAEVGGLDGVEIEEAEGFREQK